MKKVLGICCLLSFPTALSILWHFSGGAWWLPPLFISGAVVLLWLLLAGVTLLCEG